MVLRPANPRLRTASMPRESSWLSTSGGIVWHVCGTLAASGPVASRYELPAAGSLEVVPASPTFGSVLIGTIVVAPAAALWWFTGLLPGALSYS